MTETELSFLALGEGEHKCSPRAFLRVEKFRPHHPQTYIYVTVVDVVHPLTKLVWDMSTHRWKVVEHGHKKKTSAEVIEMVEQYMRDAVERML